MYYKGWCQPGFAQADLQQCVGLRLSVKLLDYQRRDELKVFIASSRSLGEFIFAARHHEVDTFQKPAAQMAVLERAHLQDERDDRISFPLWLMVACKRLAGLDGQIHRDSTTTTPSAAAPVDEHLRRASTNKFCITVNISTLQGGLPSRPARVLAGPCFRTTRVSFCSSIFLPGTCGWFQSVRCGWTSSSLALAFQQWKLNLLILHMFWRYCC